MFEYHQHLPLDLKITALIFAAYGLQSTGQALIMFAHMGPNPGILFTMLFAVAFFSVAAGLLKLSPNLRRGALIYNYYVAISAPLFMALLLSQESIPGQTIIYGFEVQSTIMPYVVMSLWIPPLLISFWMIYVLQRRGVYDLFKNAKITKQEWSAASAETEEES